MSANLARLRKRAAEFEQKKQFDRALEVYVQILDAGEDLEDEDMALFNRVGDMLMRKGSVTEALGYYERAVDVYAERGYLNNAIALCSKILRQSPGRAAVYYKLARISAKKGFKSDARKNFLEYADRMQKLGMAEEAFRALKEFASLYPDQDDVRLVLAELLSKENRKDEALEQLQSLYEKLQSEGRGAEARATVDRMRAIDPNVTPREGNTPQKSRAAGDLVFLDLNDEPAADASSNGASEPAPASARAPVPTPVPALTGLSITFIPTDAESPAHPEGFESTAVETEPVDIAPINRSLTPLGSQLVVEPVAETDPEPEPEASVPVDTLGDEVSDEPPAERAAEAPVAEEPPVEFLDDLLPDVVREAVHNEPSRHSTPMSGIEFADLELDNAPREQVTRQHDLALPGNLPVTNEFEVMTGPVPTSIAASEDARLAAQEAADLKADMAAREAQLLARSVTPLTPMHVSALEAAPEPVAEVAEPEPVDLIPDASVAEEDTSIPDDFMAMPAGFGFVEEEEEPAPAFPPLPGLDDSAAVVEAAEAEAAEAEAYLELARETTGQMPEPEEEPRVPTPRATVSIGTAEAHLRRRLELEPENWALRRQLGEALFDTGDKDGGLYELELAMVGFELQGDIDRAQEVVDEIIGVFPASVGHHQKRVEYAVRSRDRARLTSSYLELADALFRSGAGDSAVAVYGRVLELDPNNERAEFALATLAPDELLGFRGKPARDAKWTDELDRIEDPSVPVASAAEAPAPPDEETEAKVPDEPVAETVSAPQEPSRVVIEARLANIELPDPEWGDGVPTPALVEAPQEGLETRVDELLMDEEPASADMSEVGEALASAVNDLDVQPEETAPPQAELREPTPAAFARVPTPPLAPRIPTPAPVRRVATPPLAAAIEAVRKTPARRMTPVGELEDFVDLGDWLRTTEPTRSTRMQVEDPKPTGDEQADFDELLRRFKRGVAENVEAEDYEAHYDLGVAFKEMGLVDEAIAQFQKSLRGDAHRVRSYEALGQCFVEKKQYPIAAALLQRATEIPGTDDQQLVGVLYLLGFATEHQGRPTDALPYYLRVFAVDIEFRDIAARVAALGNHTT